MEENLNEVPISDDNEAVKGHKSKQFFWTKPKKMLVVLICAIIVLIIYIASILPYIGSTEVEVKDTEQPVPGPQPSGDKTNMLGKIYCLFSLKEDNEANFLSENFKVTDNISIYVDNVELSNKNSNNFKLIGKGIHNVTFALYQEIDMKNMFDGVHNLERVEMISDKNCKITSMENTFNKCKDLHTFSIKGFNTENVISLKNLFSRSSLVNIKIFHICFTQHL